MTAVIEMDEKINLGNQLLKQEKANEQQTGQFLDLQALLTWRENRLQEALVERYQYNSSVKRSQDFLLEYVRSKISLVIIYLDLVGSTDMSMTLPVEKLVSIITAFSHEVSVLIESYNGYVLKYVGDAVIGFFPSSSNKYLACNRSFECAKSIINVSSFPARLATSNVLIFRSTFTVIGCAGTVIVYQDD